MVAASGRAIDTGAVKNCTAMFIQVPWNWQDSTSSDAAGDSYIGHMLFFCQAGSGPEFPHGLQTSAPLIAAQNLHIAMPEFTSV